ncbi:hypothetical protein [Deinococcus detaillensis]|nr:hypothetical protein [Deinococcus detaillensis]
MTVSAVLGGPINPDALSNTYQALVKLAGMPRIRFHSITSC